MLKITWLFAMNLIYYSKISAYKGLAAGLLVCLLIIGCGNHATEKTDSQPNLILISIDTTRKDHCSVYGYERDTTPNLNAFGAQGARFEQAYAPTSTTGPTHATIFTSLYPIAHHVLKNGLKLSDEYVTLAEILKTQSYQTAAVISSFVLNAKFGYAQGFEFYDDAFQPEESTVKWKYWEGHRVDGSFDRRADHTTNRAIRWLKKDREQKRPFFMFVHYFDPHAPYTPPDSFLNKLSRKSSLKTQLDKTISKYDDEITFTDQQIGKLLKTLKEVGLRSQTLVVITADHGEGLMQHNHMEHGVNIYDELVRVPLLFSWHNHIPMNRVLNTPVGLIDLAPTILDLLDIKADSWSVQGQSLAEALRGQVPLDPMRPVFLFRRHYNEGTVGHTWVKGKKFGIRVGKWKYIEGFQENTKELFDLENDPNELINLYDNFPKKSLELASKLQEWKQENTRANSNRGQISKEDSSRLRSLGYVE